MADRSKRKLLQIRDRLSQVAARLFQMHGYESVTMEQIAAAADVARGTLYNHFPFKEAVLAYWIHGQLAKDLPALTRRALGRGSLNDGLATVLEASARWWEAHRDYAAPFLRHRFQSLRNDQPGASSSAMTPVYEQLIEAARQADQIAHRAGADRLANYLHFLYLSALVRWLENPGVSLTQEFAHALDFFMRATTAAHSPAAVR